MPSRHSGRKTPAGTWKNLANLVMCLTVGWRAPLTSWQTVDLGSAHFPREVGLIDAPSLH